MWLARASERCKQTLYGRNLTVSCDRRPEAASVIRTDVQRGSIKAGVISFAGLVEVGSVAEAEPEARPVWRAMATSCRTQTWWSPASVCELHHVADVVEFSSNRLATELPQSAVTEPPRVR